MGKFGKAVATVEYYTTGIGDAVIGLGAAAGFIALGPRLSQATGRQFLSNPMTGVVVGAGTVAAKKVAGWAFADPTTMARLQTNAALGAARKAGIDEATLQEANQQFNSLIDDAEEVRREAHG